MNKPIIMNTETYVVQLNYCQFMAFFFKAYWKDFKNVLVTQHVFLQNYVEIFLIPSHLFFYALLWFPSTLRSNLPSGPQSWESGPLEYLCQDGSVIRIRGDNTFWFSARIFLSIRREKKQRLFSFILDVPKKNTGRIFFRPFLAPRGWTQANVVAF